MSQHIDLNGDSIVDGWYIWWNASGNDSGTFTYQNTSTNFPENTMFDSIFIKKNIMIFDRATNNIKRYAPGYIPVDFDMHETSANSNGQRDWISEFGARAAKDFKYGNLIGYQNKTKILDILERLSR